MTRTLMAGRKSKISWPACHVTHIVQYKTLHFVRVIRLRIDFMRRKQLYIRPCFISRYVPGLRSDLDQGQWSKITQIIVHQRNRWICDQSGFINSFDMPWSQWTAPDHPKRTHRLIIWCDTLINKFSANQTTQIVYTFTTKTKDQRFVLNSLNS